ncbi:MAG: nucleocapsid protein [Angavokely henipavirus]|nr:MAG: nucleocapsid protein [Angavokely henipavirus]
MSSILTDVAGFRKYLANLGREGRPSAATSSLTTVVWVFTPINSDPELRWRLLNFLLKLIWSPAASESIKTGAMMSILALYTEKPGAFVRGLVNDPDIEIMTIDVGAFDGNIPRLERRGSPAEQETAILARILQSRPTSARGTGPFIEEAINHLEIRDPATLLTALATVLGQIWILLAKSVTAPDTAEESEQRRWQKLIQQRRVDQHFTLSPSWINEARHLISSNLSVRKFMVENLVELRKSEGTKGRITEMIADIGNYIEETGLSGFFLTIKFGLETKYPAIALNEFQSDINVMQSLIELYKSLGPRAPFMVLLEEAIQTKFAPGNYPILWSFAMGVGTTIDRAVSALNINRTYLDPVYFRLGQKVARHHSGTLDMKMAEALGITEDQKKELSLMMGDVGKGTNESGNTAREGKFTLSAGVVNLQNNSDTKPNLDDLTSQMTHDDSLDLKSELIQRLISGDKPASPAKSMQPKSAIKAIRERLNLSTPKRDDDVAGNQATNTGSNEADLLASVE